MTRARWQGLVAVAAVGLLAGCASVARTPDPSFGKDEIDAIYEKSLDIYWQSLGFDDELRPAPVTYRLVSNEEWWGLYVQCMQHAGFESYGVDPFPYPDTRTVAEQNTQMLAEFGCNQQFMNDPASAGMLNSAQAEYAYDYFQQTLIPCLALRGIEVRDAPTRESFLGEFGWWNPYWSVDPELLNDLLADRELLIACPPLAPGLPDQGYFGSIPAG